MRILRILIEHIEFVWSLESGLSFDSICSFENLYIFEVITKTCFLKISQNGQPYPNEVDIIIKQQMNLLVAFEQNVDEKVEGFDFRIELEQPVDNEGNVELLVTVLNTRELVIVKVLADLLSIRYSDGLM